MGRISIEMTPKPVGFDSDIACGTKPGALENSVFDEMADAVELGGFVPRTPPDPDARSNRPQSGHVFGQDGDPIRKSGGLNVVNHLLEPKTLRLTSTEVESGGLNPSTL